MADNLNVVALQGNLTRDAELKHTNSGTAICEFSLAVNNWFGKDHASFFNVTIFGKQAESVQQYLMKGKPVEITGKVKQERWTDQNGNNRSKVVIIADKVHLLSSGETKGQDKEPDTDNPDIDDIDF